MKATSFFFIFSSTLCPYSRATRLSSTRVMPGYRQTSRVITALTNAFSGLYLQVEVWVSMRPISPTTSRFLRAVETLVANVDSTASIYQLRSNSPGMGTSPNYFAYTLTLLFHLFSYCTRVICRSLPCFDYTRVSTEGALPHCRRLYRARCLYLLTTPA